MKVGMRVDTRYGQGTVKGFERFAKNGTSAHLSETFNGDERIAVDLDPGHTWLAPPGMLCYIVERELRPALRPIAEVMARGTQCLDHRDFSRLTEFLPAEQWEPLGFQLKPGEKHEPKDWTYDNVVAQLKTDVEFGFEKALNHKGISSTLMAGVVGMWLFALQDEKGLQVLQSQYAQYGLPVFKYAAVKYGFPNPIGDDTGSERKYACN